MPRKELAWTFPPDYVSVDTLAHRLDCSVTTIRSYVQRGLLPCPIKLGELVRWRWNDVERFIRSLEARPQVGIIDDPYLVNLENLRDGATKKASD